MAKLKVTQIKSTIGRIGKHARTVHALGLKRLNQTVIHDDSPTIRGMIFKVKHLVEVEELDNDSAKG